MYSYQNSPRDFFGQCDHPARGSAWPGCSIQSNCGMPPAVSAPAPSRDGTLLNGSPRETGDTEEEHASAVAIYIFIGMSILFDILKWRAPEFLVKVSAIDYSQHNLAVIKKGLDFGGGVHLFIGIVMLLHLMWRAWWVVQPAKRLRCDLRIPKPGRAVWLLLIPLFNFYWVFVAFKNLMDAANALRIERHLPSPPFCSEIAGLFASVTIAATLLPSLWCLMYMPLPQVALTTTLLHQLAVITDWYLGLEPLPQIVSAAAWHVGRILLLPIARDVARVINTLG